MPSKAQPRKPEVSPSRKAGHAAWHLPADDLGPPTDNRRCIAYLDCFSGISGDMFLGALIDAGVSAQVFEDTVESLDLGARLEISRVNRSGISATKVDVVVNGSKDLPHEAEVHQHETHGLPHEHGQGQKHEPKHAHEHGRGLNQIVGVINAAKIRKNAKQTAIAIFEKLGAAEAKIHHVPVEKIHFHEVGAVDALVDIVCAAVGAERLGVDEFVCSPLNVGGGTVECAHGTFPVPAPATVELLKGMPIYSSGVQAELVTPTGVAIVATLVKRFAAFPAMEIQKSGYGAGSRDFPRQPNVLRITVGQTVGDGARATRDRAIQSETITVLEANLDDLNPQVFGYVMERLLETGALDVFCVPVQMKKNRPGTLLTVLTMPENADQLAQIIFNETTTLGIRRRQEQRQVLARRWQTVTTRFGDVRIKIANMNGSVSNYAPEYEDCRRIAAEKKIPLKTVMADAMEAYVRSLRG